MNACSYRARSVSRLLHVIALCVLILPTWFARDGKAASDPASASLDAQSPVPAATPAMVVLVRHAEKAAQPADDPPLTPKGRERAKALAEALDHAGVTSIITTQWVRTKDTAAPLATSLKIAPEVVRMGQGDTRDAEAVAAAVRRHAGGVVLVVGHSNTVPAIVAALGGPRLPDICNSVFDDLFLLVPAGKEWRFVRSRYGAPTPAPAGCR